MPSRRRRPDPRARCTTRVAGVARPRPEISESWRALDAVDREHVGAVQHARAAAPPSGRAGPAHRRCRAPASRRKPDMATRLSTTGAGTSRRGRIEADGRKAGSPRRRCRAGRAPRTAAGTRSDARRARRDRASSALRSVRKHRGLRHGGLLPPLFHHLSRQARGCNAVCRAGTADAISTPLQ